MKRFYNRDSSLIFVDKNLKIQTRESKKYNLILSPSLYWTKIERELPIKRVSEVKKLASSLLDGMLPSDGDFLFRVKKLRESEFLIIAFDKNRVKSILDELNIELSTLDSIYFAQNEFDSIENPISINNEDSLINIDGVVQKIPSRYIKAYSTPVKNILNSLSLSKERFSAYDLEDKFIDSKSFYILTTLLSLIVILNLVEYFLYKIEIDRVYQARDKVFQRYNLPATTFQLESIKSKFISIDREQIKLREKLYYLDKTPLLRGEHFKELDLKNAKIDIALKLNRQNRAEAIKNYLIKEFKIDSIRVKDDTLYAKMSI